MRDSWNTTAKATEVPGRDAATVLNRQEFTDPKRIGTAGTAHPASMNFASSFLPNGRVAFHHAEKSITLTRKEASGPESSKEVSLAELCKESTPSKCKLNPFLFNGHLQTAWTVVKNDDVPVYYKRWTFESVNPSYMGSFDVDFVVPPYDSPATATSTPSRCRTSSARVGHG